MPPDLEALVVGAYVFADWQTLYTRVFGIAPSG